jgi:hypothetical protein
MSEAWRPKRQPRTYGGYPERQWVALPQSMEYSVSDCSFPDTIGALYLAVWVTLVS